MALNRGHFFEQACAGKLSREVESGFFGAEAVERFASESRSDGHRCPRYYPEPLLDVVNRLNIGRSERI